MKLFTSESVTEGHPDKICDQISDAILDAVLEEDPLARVACETAITTGKVIVMGEISTNCQIDIKDIVKKRIRKIGYVDDSCGFNVDDCEIMVFVDEQSADIAMGVDDGIDLDFSKNQGTGAGDQGMMIGYATDETKELMPLPIVLAHRLTKRLAIARNIGLIPYLRPDGKAQVTVKYKDGKPIGIHTIIVSAQHMEGISRSRLAKDINEHVINEVIDGDLIDDDTKIFVNPTGRFVIGGPQADTGLTGRKIIVDTYGGVAGHGGGAFSGKDPTKVDRSGAYAARYIAKNIVAAKLASKCKVEIAYAIGISQPVSIHADTYGTGTVEDERLAEAVTSCFDLSPEGIIDNFSLRKPLYTQISTYGHFGRNELDLPWEMVDKAEELVMNLGLVTAY